MTRKLDPGISLHFLLFLFVSLYKMGSITVGSFEITKQIAGTAWFRSLQGQHMHMSMHVFYIRVGVLLKINTCGKQGRVLETAAGNS